MEILLTNDDGIYAPGLEALERELQRLGHVTVVAPATEQSGVGHSITFLSPLICKEVYEGERRRGWAVEGSPADCVKIGIFKFCPRRPDLVVSGMNGGLNAGINVLYSGTVAAAIEGAFFGITSVAVSLEFDEHAQYEQAAAIAGRVVRTDPGPETPATATVQLEHSDSRHSTTDPAACGADEHCALRRTFHRTQGPERSYVLLGSVGPGAARRRETETDLSALERGCVTLSPLQYDMTDRAAIQEWRTGSLTGVELDSATLVP